MASGSICVGNNAVRGCCASTTEHTVKTTLKNVTFLAYISENLNSLLQAKNIHLEALRASYAEWYVFII